MDETLTQRISDLEKKAIQLQLTPTDQENLKNNLFDVFTNVISSDAESAYLKVIWKDKQFFVKSHTLPIALTDGATVDVDCNKGDLFTLTATQNFTLNNPTNMIDGQKIIFKIKQDATGSRVITWGSDFRGSTDLSLPTLSTTANMVDYIGFIYNSTAGKWDCLASNKGFSS